jgi:ubiquitin-conjugating enzyme E2 J2
MALSLHTKRIQGDIRLLSAQPLEGINVCYDDNNMLTWYFLISGSLNTDYVGGEYIGRIVFDTNYPKTAPEFYMETPNGRFEVGKKICLSNSKFHQSEWSMSWTIHAIVLAFVSIMYEDTDKGISHIVKSKEERKILATKSIEWNIKNMPRIYKKLKEDYLGMNIKDAKTSDNKTFLVVDANDVNNKVKILNSLITIYEIRQKKNKQHKQKHKEIIKIIKKFQSFCK